MTIQTEFRQQTKSKEIEQKVFEVGPQNAKAWLERNTGNRNVRQAHVRHLAEQMRLGRWKLSPEPIVFSRKGRLLDGQHRLLAVVMSGKTISVSVALVEDESVFEVLDQGANRSNSDILNVPSAVLTPVQWLHRAAYRSSKITPQDLMPVMNTEMFKLSTDVHEIIKPKNKRFKAAYFRAAYIASICMGHISKERATQVYSDLASMNLTEWNRMMQHMMHLIDNTSQAESKNSSSLYHLNFMRAMYMFENIDTKKTTIRVGDKFTDETAAEIKAHFRKVFKK